MNDDRPSSMLRPVLVALGFAIPLFILSAHLAHVRAAQWTALLMLLIAGVVSVSAIRKQFASFPRGIWLACVTWCAYALLSTLWSPVPRETLELALSDTLLPLAGLMGAWLLARHQQLGCSPSAGAWLVATACLSGISVLALMAGETAYLKQGDGEITHFAALLRYYPGPGLQSTFMVLGCAMLAWLRTQRVPDWLWCCALLALLFNAFATFNRMTVIVLTLLMATALVLRVTLACQPLSRKQLLTRLTVIFCAAGLLGSAGLVLISSGRFDASLKKEGVAVTTQNIQTDIRYTMWRYWTDVARNKPVFGHGFGKPSGNASHDIHHPLFPQISQPDIAHPHNLLVSLAVQTGLVGIILFLGMQAMLLREGIRLVRHPTTRTCGVALVLLCVGLLTKNATDDFYDRTLSNLFFIYAGLILGTASRTRSA